LDHPYNPAIKDKASQVQKEDELTSLFIREMRKAPVTPEAAGEAEA
jgi:hypothetical protein